jgi:hypothetical protein
MVDDSGDGGKDIFLRSGQLDARELEFVPMSVA